MATYNDSNFLPYAIESILRQTFHDFEFIIIDDASTDETLNVLKKYDDSRIYIIRNTENLGLAASLNRGIRISKGKYIVRMDADDVSYPERIEQQITYLDRNPDVSVLGTQWQAIDKNGKVIRVSDQPLKHGLIMWTYLTRLAYPLTHPTVAMRREFLTKLGGYNTHYRREQDGELFLRAIQSSKYANLPDILYQYRKHKSRVVAKAQFSEYYETTIKIRRNCISRFLHRNVDLDVVKALIFPTPKRLREAISHNPSINTTKKAIQLLLEIYIQMRNKGFFTDEEKICALIEIPDLVTNILHYCQDYVFRACNSASVKEVTKYLLSRLKKGGISKAKKLLRF